MPPSLGHSQSPGYQEMELVGGRGQWGESSSCPVLQLWGRGSSAWIGGLNSLSSEISFCQAALA